MSISTVFVIYLTVEWESSHQRRLYEAMAKLFQGNATLLCINRPPICPFFTPLKKPNRILKWVKTKGKPVRAKDIHGNSCENIWLYRPWVFLHDQLAIKSRMITSMNRWILFYQFKKCLSVLGLSSAKNRIIWLATPLLFDWLHIIREDLIVYECEDEYSAYPGHSNRKKRLIRAYEKKLLSEVNIVTAVSHELKRTKGELHNNVHLLPNGVELEHFNKANAEETTIPDDIASIPKPIIGFVGGIWGIFDVELIRYIALSCPERSLVLVGNLSSIGSSSFFKDFKQLVNLRNVHWLGWKQYILLPNYLKAMDVCLLPYILDEWTINCYPEKLHQYQAAGKPVVSTGLPEIKPISEVVEVAQTHEEFLEKIDKFLDTKENTHSILKRVEIASKNTWEERASRVVEILSPYLI